MMTRDLAAPECRAPTLYTINFWRITILVGDACSPG